MGAPVIKLPDVDMEGEDPVAPSSPEAEATEAPPPAPPRARAPAPRAKAGRKPKEVPTESFQLHITPETAQDIRLQAVLLRRTHSDLMEEAWELWRKKHGKDVEIR